MKDDVAAALALGFMAGMMFSLLLDAGQRRRDHEKIRRHLERALEAVDE